MPAGFQCLVHRLGRTDHPDVSADFRRARMTVMELDELRDIALIAGPELELASAEHIIEWAVATFGERFCITSSMSDAVLAHLASTVAPGIDVVFLDTGLHFVETIGTRDAVDATMPVNVVTLSPN